MEGTDYNIANLFAESFGLKVSKAYSPSVGNGLADDPKGVYQGIEFVDEEEATELSQMGTPILFPITFLAGPYIRYDDQGKIEHVQMEDFRLPVSCIADFRQAKIIAKTNVSGGKGTVKEIFGFDDWQIGIKGFFLPERNHPQGLEKPLDQELKLLEWVDLACSVGILGHLFTMRGIHAITIEDFNVTTERGRPKARPFSLTATSDETVIFKIGRI